MTTPSVRALRQRFPEARIDFLVAPGSRPVLEGNPHIDGILEHRAGGTLDNLRSIEAEVVTASATETGSEEMIEKAAKLQAVAILTSSIFK